MKIKVKKLHPDAKLPTYSTEGAGAFDIYSHPETEVSTVGIWYPLVVRTGLAFEIPDGHGLFVLSRSGHAFKNETRLSNSVGLLDSDYRGELMVKLCRDAGDGRHLTVGPLERIAQAVVLPLPRVFFEEVVELEETERGEGGFGSTGVK